jgi:hypothetical protein
MMLSFADLLWHDAVILAIQVPRRQPGAVDEVLLSMHWPDGRQSTIAFVDCYGFNAAMNLGVVAPETVSTAIERSEGNLLQQVRGKWDALGVDLSNLREFTIETNSTASTLTVLALGWADRETP